VVDELLVKLRKAGFLVFGYADNVAKGNFLSILKERMDDALRIIQNCVGIDKGLTVNPSRS